MKATMLAEMRAALDQLIHNSQQANDTVAEIGEKIYGDALLRFDSFSKAVQDALREIRESVSANTAAANKTMLAVQQSCKDYGERLKALESQVAPPQTVQAAPPEPLAVIPELKPAEVAAGRQVAQEAAKTLKAELKKGKRHRSRKPFTPKPGAISVPEAVKRYGIPAGVFQALFRMDKIKHINCGRRGSYVMEADAKRLAEAGS